MEVHDGLRLIEEVRKRPKLWVKKRKKNVEKLWTEVGRILDTEASLCKRSWQIMRVRFWVETKRVIKRIAKDKEKGTYNPDKKYTNWHLFDTLRFLENVQSGHRKYHTVGDISDVDIAKSKTAQRTTYSKRKCIKNKNVTQEKSPPDQLIIPTNENPENFEQDIKNFLNSPATKYEKNSNENPSHRSNTFVKKEPELQIEADCFDGANFVKVAIKEEIPEQNVPSEEHHLQSPDLSDENYSFLYSFVSQTKLMSQSLKLEFRIKMKNLLLYIFPASSSVDIFENQLLLAVHDDPDKKFLISFWPFMKSMSLTQNLEFRAKVADLVFTILSRNKK